ncbi:MAG: serine protease [Desulfobacterales bacterium]
MLRSLVGLLFCMALVQPVRAADAISVSTRDAILPLPKIMGGIEADPEAWPWVVALLTPGSGSDLYFDQYCAGVLIDDSWVLTAAHCVSGLAANEVEVAVGVFDLRDPSNVRTPVAAIRVHPRYNPTTLLNDVALLRLSGATQAPTVKLYSGASREALPENLLGQYLTAIGWGLADGSSLWFWPDRLRQVYLPVVPASYCNNSYLYPLQSSQFCAGFQAGKDSCIGDSGGPLVANVDGEWVHAGIVSYGAPCDVYSGWYGVYTRTSAYVDFIKKYVPKARFTRPAGPPLPFLFLLIDR